MSAFSMSQDEFQLQAELESGICRTCHEFQPDVKPMAVRQHCDGCDTPTVVGLERALVLGVVELNDEPYEVGPSPYLGL